MIFTRYRPDIDGLRALAITSVVFFHGFPSLFSSGFIGVDIFFTISGYLITSIIFKSLIKGDFSFINFYQHRIRRIFPALSLVLFTSFLLGYLFLTPNEYYTFGYSSLFGSLFLENIYLIFSSGYFENSAELKPLLHLWSLGIEEQFYIFWPIILFLTFKRNYCNLFLFLLLFTSFVLMLMVSNIYSFYLPLTRFWELLIGALGAFINYKWVNFRNILSITHVKFLMLPLISFICLCTAFISINNTDPYPNIFSILPTFGTLFFLVSSQDSFINRFFSKTPFVFLGLISYPLYLWHWILLSFSRIILGTTLSYIYIALIIFFSCILSYLTYKFIEVPLKRISNLKALSIFLCMLLFLMTLLSSFLIFNHGFANRDLFLLKVIHKKFHNDFKVKSDLIVNGYSDPISTSDPSSSNTFLSEIELSNNERLINEIKDYRSDHESSYRVGKCLLRPEQDFESFSDCGIFNRDLRKKTLFLWGDSYAAALYPGLDNKFSHRINIIQRTASSCPPILGRPQPERNFCLNINTQVFKEIEQVQPDIVVLSANWWGYGSEDWVALSETIQKLHSAGVKTIQIFGPVPYWQDSLPKQVIIYSNAFPGKLLPTRTNFGLNPWFKKFDPILKGLALENNAYYFSPINALCNDEGCLLRVGSTGDSITAWDNGHLTKAGSIYVVNKFTPKW